MLSLFAAACCVAAVPGFQEVTLPEPAPLPMTRVFHLGAQVDFTHALHRHVKTVHGRTDPVAFEVWGAWLFDERAGIGLRGGLSRRRGLGVAPALPDEDAGETALAGDAPVGPPETVLWQIPLAIEGRLRLALVRDQPVVPYLRAGVGAMVAIERLFSPDPVDPAAGAEAADGAAEEEVVDDREARVADSQTTWVKATVHGGGGVQIRVPFPEVQWEGSMAGASMLSDVYVYIEGWGRAANNFGADGADFSSMGVSVGATVLF